MFTVTKKVLNFQIEVCLILVSIPADTVPHCTIMVRLLHVTILTRIQFGASIDLVPNKFSASVIILYIYLYIYIYIYVCVCVCVCVCVFSRKMYLKVVRLKFFTGMLAKSGITP